MPLWQFLLIYAGTFLLTELLRPKPRLEDAKPAGLGDFNVPTATEGRPVPIIWGRCLLSGPNVVWYGDLQAEPIREKVKTGLFSSDKVTVGFRYKIGLQMALCSGNETPITLRNIRIDESAAWGEDASTADAAVTPGDSGGAFTINQPEFFGGEDSGGGGGIVGSGTIYPGSRTQSASSYLASFQTPTPAYRGTVYVTWEAGEIGLAPQLRAWAFEVERYPDGLDLATFQPGAEVVNEGANPLNVVYEALTNYDFGLNQGPASINVAGWRTLAQQLADEGQGFAMVWDRKLDAKEIIRLVEQQVDGILFQDPSTGIWDFKLVRDDYTPGTLPLVDESNAHRLTRFQRPAWDETQNIIQAEFQDRRKNYATGFGIAQDMANVDIVQSVKPSSIRFPGCKDPSLANLLAWRELRQLSYPAASGEVITDRTFYDVTPGDVLELSWGRLGITRLPIRITKVDRGQILDNKIKLTWTQDIFTAPAGVFADPTDTNWIPPSDQAQAPLYSFLWEVPYRITALPTTANNTTATQVGVILVRNGGLHVGYNIFATTTDLPGTAAGPTENDIIPPGFSSGFAPYGELTAAIDRGETNGFQDAVGFTVDATVDVFNNLEDATASELEAGKNIALIDDELILFSTVTDNGNGTYTISNLIRGALDTIPAPHGIDSKVYFFSYGLGLVNETPFSDGTQNIQAKLQTFTPFNTLVFGSAPQVGVDTDSRSAKAYPPRDVQVNAGTPGGGTFPTEIVGTFDVTWKGSNKFNQAFATAWDDPHVSQEANSGFKLRVIEDPAGAATEKLLISGIPSGTTGGQYIASGYCDDTITDAYRIELSSVNAAGESQVWGVSFTVYGYGYKYGENYGGDTAGTIVPRGDPPEIIDPIPGVSTQYVSQITLSGTFDTRDDLYVRVSFYDFAAGAYTLGDYVLNGATKTKLEDYLSDLAERIAIDFDPLKVSVQQTGLTLTLTSFFGSLTTRITNDTVVASTSILQEASSPVTGRAGSYFVDFYQLDNDGFEELSPDFSEVYNTDASGSIRVEINGLTLETKRSISQNSFTTAWGGFSSAPGQSVPYSRGLIGDTLDPNSIEPIEAELAKLFGVDSRPDAPSGVFSGFATNVGSGVLTAVLPGEQATRSGAYIQMVANYTFSIGSFFETTSPNTPYGSTIKALSKTAVPPIESYPDGVAQVSEVRWTREFNNNGTSRQQLIAGQVFFVELNGVRYTHTVDASDVSDAPYFDGIFTDIANQIDALTDYDVIATNTLLREPGGATFITSIEIQRVAGGSTFTCKTGGQFGAEWTVSNFTQ